MILRTPSQFWSTRSGQARRHRLALLLMVGGFAFSGARGAEDILVRQAREALRESIPSVAIEKLTAFLTAEALPAASRAEATRLLGEGLLAGGRLPEALEMIEPLVREHDEQALRLRADVLGAQSRWEEALPIYSGLARQKNASAATRMGEIEALAATGQGLKAIAKLEALVAAGGPVTARLRLAALELDFKQAPQARATLAGALPERGPERKWKGLLEGRALLLEGQPAAALVVFQALLKDVHDLSEEMQVAATFGATDALILIKGDEQADGELLGFLRRNPNSVYLEAVFARLDSVYARLKEVPDNTLRAWAQKEKGPSPREAFSRFYMACIQMRAGRFESAGNWLDLFVRGYPRHPLLARVHGMQAELALKKRDFPAAVRALEAAERQALDVETRTEIELRMGLVHYQAGEYLLAANLFDSVARRSPRLRETAFYNGALAALNQRNPRRFLDLYSELSTHFPSSALCSELILEQGLLQARSGDARAQASLEIFLREFPKHARTVEARLALAELAQQAGKIDLANDYRLAVNAAAPAPEIDDQSRVLAIFLADSQVPRRDEAIVELALAFIKERAGSPLLPEVRMKLGEVYFRKNDFADAETQLATLARETPESEYAESALYLAGQAAMKSINSNAVDRALGLFDQVIKREGELKLYARQQQAIVQSGLGKETEALKLYEIILNELAANKQMAVGELGYAALIGKGDNLLALGHKEPGQLEEAVRVFAQLAAMQEVPATWRNQALYKKAKALELLFRVPEALAAYYDVLDATASTQKGREFFWLSKAGFDAARIFEAQEQWRQAIGIYEKLALLGGPRAAEARALMKQLRLEHFIWE